MKRRILSLITAIVILLVMVSCSGAPTPSDTTPNDTTPSDSPSDETSAPKGNVEIEFWDMMWGPADTYTAAATALIDKFNAENTDGITVTLQMTPWDNFYQTFLTAVTSGAAPDASTGACPQPIQYAAMGESLDLNPILAAWEAEKSPILDEIPQAMFDFYKMDGVQYGIPWNLDPRGITYRKDLFEEAGITELPNDWDSFAEALRKVKVKFPDIIPFAFSAGDQMSTHSIISFLINNEIGFVDKDLNPTFTDPKVIETLEYFKMLYEEGLISEGTASYKGSDVEKIFMSNQAATWYGGAPSGLVGTELYDKCGILPPFKGPSATKAQNYYWINGVQGYNQTENPDATRTFIKWWTENNLTLFVDGLAGAMPARSSYYDEPYFSENWIKAEFYEKAIKGGTTVVYPAPSLYVQFPQIEGEDIVGKALREIFVGEKDMKALAEKVQANLKTALENE